MSGHSGSVSPPTRWEAAPTHPRAVDPLTVLGRPPTTPPPAVGRDRGSDSVSARSRIGPGRLRWVDHAGRVMWGTTC